MDPLVPDTGDPGKRNPEQGLERVSVPGLPAGLADCWNEIGVNGDSTCARLVEVSHCRNCPVYSAAAAQVLDRQLPDGYRVQWLEHLSVAKKEAAAGKESVVIFRVGPEWLALTTRVFRQIAEQRKVHSLPHRRDGIVLGVTNVRGALLVCVSLARLVGLERQAPGARPRTMYERLVVVEWEGKPLVFPADEVYGIHRHRAEELAEPPAIVTKAAVHFTRGLLTWAGRKVSCLDEELLFAALNRSLA